MTLCWGTQFLTPYDDVAANGKRFVTFLLEENDHLRLVLKMLQTHTAYLFMMTLWFVPALCISVREQGNTAWDSPENELPSESKAQITMGIDNLEMEPEAVIGEDSPTKQKVHYFWTAFYFMFHIVSALAVTSMATKIPLYGKNALDDLLEENVDKNTAEVLTAMTGLFVVNVIAIVVCVILYLIYLIAPLCCPKRFSTGASAGPLTETFQDDDECRPFDAVDGPAT